MQILSRLLLAITISGAAVLPAPSLRAVGDTNAAPEEAIDWKKERGFWAFRPPTLHARPMVKNKRWPSQPLDYFVLARLERTNLSPTTAADKRTLIRRVSFDL